ncbi:MAG: HAD hydrolase-like protein [Candidatus Sumerlaeia bacterium]|nr:HAD hydrolase-like protein [Candidatus Sumerlaeia bacterium]
MTQSQRPWVVFDLDGTLVDSFADIHAALSSGLQEMHLPGHTLIAVKGMVGHGMRNLVRQALPENSSVELEDELIQRTLHHYGLHPYRFTKPFAGIPELCQKIAPHARLAVLSNKPHHLTLEVMNACQLSPLFEVIQGQLDYIPIKPDPQCLWNALGETNAERIALVGDGAADAQLSRNTGIHFIGVAWGTSKPEELEEFGVVVEDITELEDKLLEWLKGKK